MSALEVKTLPFEQTTCLFQVEIVRHLMDQRASGELQKNQAAAASKPGTVHLKNVLGQQNKSPSLIKILKLHKENFLLLQYL